MGNRQLFVTENPLTFLAERMSGSQAKTDPSSLASLAESHADVLLDDVVDSMRAVGQLTRLHQADSLCPESTERLLRDVGTLCGLLANCLAAGLLLRSTADDIVSDRNFAKRPGEAA